MLRMLNFIKFLIIGVCVVKNTKKSWYLSFYGSFLVSLKLLLDWIIFDRRRGWKSHETITVFF